MKISFKRSVVIFTLVASSGMAQASTGDTVISYSGMPFITKYRVGFIAGNHGHLEGNTWFYVEEKQSIKKENVPQAIPDKGYVFDKWINKSYMTPVKDWGNEIITRATDYQAEFKKSAPTEPSKPTTTKVVNTYRLYNKNTGEHFYTQSVYERDSLIRVGWQNEGLGWKAPATGKPIYRLYNPNAKGGDHYYTMSAYEADSLVKAGWRKDNNGKPVFYSGGNVKVYVAYNPNAESGAHNYTTSKFEQDSLLKNGWKYGAVAWYGM